MGNDIKVFIGIIGFTALLVVGLAIWQGGKKGDSIASNNEPLGQVEGIETSPEDYDLGNVPINGGIVTKEYEIKNTTDAPMTLGKIVTSCMCTEAKVSLGDHETRFFGMEHPGDKNPPINFEIPPGETAKVTVNFDPAAHGPQGVGPFDRVVSLIFKEPVGTKELTFKGAVVR
jgi:hypothetical protein